MSHRRYTAINDGEANIDTPLIEVRSVQKGGTPKNLGYLFSAVFIVLCTFGYPMINMSLVYFQAGVIPVAILWVIFTCTSLFINLLFADGIALIDGNSNYELCLEFTGLGKELFRRSIYYIFLFLFLFYQIAANVTMTRIVAQAADDFLVLVSKNTYGLQLYPHPAVITVPDTTYFYNNGDHIVIAITAGYALTTAILLPMALFQLSGTLWVQGILMIPVALSCIEFIVFFAQQGFNAQVPLVGSNWTQVMGPIIFNLGIGAIMPAWLNQKKPEVNTIKVMASVYSVTMALNMLLPILGTFVYGRRLTSDIFELMTSINTNVLVRISVYVYTLTVIAASIPINNIMIKNNIFSEVYPSKALSLCIGVFLQYMIGWLVLSGGIFTAVLNYVSLFIGGFYGYFFPLIMYWVLQTRHEHQHGCPGSPIGLLPPKVRPYWRTIVIICLCMTGIPTVAQIIINFYHLIAFGKNIS